MKNVRLPDELLEEAMLHANVNSRTLPKQIEHWVKLGKIAEENPDLPYCFIKDILLGLEEENLDEYESPSN